MTDNKHPITPPPELVEQWLENTRSQDCIGAYPANYEQLICTQAARWGADQELEACCEWVEREIGHGREWGAELRAARRPKPPSLKEQSIALIDKIQSNKEMWDIRDLDVIRRALESLPD